MTIVEALRDVRLLFLDTAPVIYHVENVAGYSALTDEVFLRLRAGQFKAVTSPITLAECLVQPYRNGDATLAQQFVNVVTQGINTHYVGIDTLTLHAAELRAHYNFSLPDAFQVAVAIASGCDAFLTNDLTLKRVTEITVLVLDELEPPTS